MRKSAIILPLKEIIKGDSIFCATGITSGDLVSGIKVEGNEFTSETLVTHKSANFKEIIKLKMKIWLDRYLPDV